MASSYELEPGYVIADRYRVVSQLGEGGMGQVYLVQQVKTDEHFALKILNPSVAQTPSARERFRREAKTPARIDSDHVARVVDTDIATDLGDAPFLVMEYLRGHNLQDLSDELGPLAPNEVLIYLRQVALALERAHAIGIVHRDLKPENLFLTTRDDGSPCVKVLDFGIAKLSGATGDLVNVKATATGDIFGTPMFMSPEQCLSQAEKISAQSDIWALGLIAYRLLTGSDFWTANTLTHLIAQIAYEPIPKPSEQPGIDLGPSFDTWFATCCNREVEARFASATEAVAALQTALGVGPDTSQALPPLAGLAVPPRASKPAGSKPSSGSHTDLVTGDTSLDASSPDVSSPDVSSPDRGALLKTSEALTLDSIDRSAVRPRSRRGLLAFAAVAVVGVALVGVWAMGGLDPRSDLSDATAAPAASVAAELPTPSEPTSVATATAEPAASSSAAIATVASAAPSTSASVPAPKPPPPPVPRYVPPPPPPPPPQPPPPDVGVLDRRH